MKYYIATGIGDFFAIDSFLTNQEKHDITEIYWGCRAGHFLKPLLENNDFYPNLNKQFLIPSKDGKELNTLTSPIYPNWHFPPNMPSKINDAYNFFGIDYSDVVPMQTLEIMQSDQRVFNECSFLKKAFTVNNEKYILVHAATSFSREHDDFKKIQDDWWQSIEDLSVRKKMPVIIISDVAFIPALTNYQLYVNASPNILVSLIIDCEYFIGVDSFGSVLASRCIPPEKIKIFSGQNIESKINYDIWWQKYFAPNSSSEYAKFFYREVRDFE
jgi:hypothetical protein